jgi:hypothetical protein
VTAKCELIGQSAVQCGCRGDPVAFLMCLTVYVISFGRTCVRQFILTWVQFGQLRLNQPTKRNKQYACAEW